MDRKKFLQLSVLTGLATTLKGKGSAQSVQKVSSPVVSALTNMVAEWSFDSAKQYEDPFNQVMLDVEIVGEHGEKWMVPAFWRGGQVWTVRFAAGKPGLYQYRTFCNDTDNFGLHSITGEIRISAYQGTNPLYAHGPVRVAKDKGHFEHADGTPFFWLADTWWLGLCARFRWPEDFTLLTEDRVKKGFTVVQMTAGLNPVMDAFDKRSANEAGVPWEKDYARINPGFYELADLRIQHLVSEGIMPCIFACWGYNVLMMGLEKMKAHWRYLIARWGACPVTWSLAGEGSMAWFGSKDKPGDAAKQIDLLGEIAKYVRSADPYRRMLTVHPDAGRGSGRKSISDPSLLDFDMLHTGHLQYRVLPHTINTLRWSVRQKPDMPVINGEVCYENAFDESPASFQRFLFWSCILSGAVAGHAYGADGIWQFITEETHDAGYNYVNNQHWGWKTWKQQYDLPGSQQVGISKRKLMEYSWWLIEPHQEWLDVCWDGDIIPKPFAGGIPGKLRIAFIPTILKMPIIKNIEKDIRYQAHFFNPINGERSDIGVVMPDSSGNWQPPFPGVIHDWMLVLEAIDHKNSIPA